MSSNMQCDLCSHYDYDDEYEYYVCEVNLDEDEMERFLKGTYTDCPYFLLQDEYSIVRKQN